MAFARNPVVSCARFLLESVSILWITATNEDLKTVWIRAAERGPLVVELNR
jgi:hypothetical protein